MASETIGSSSETALARLKDLERRLESGESFESIIKEAKPVIMNIDSQIQDYLIALAEWHEKCYIEGNLPISPETEKTLGITDNEN